MKRKISRLLYCLILLTMWQGEAVAQSSPGGIGKWIEHIKSGRPFSVVLDQTRFDDSQWSGDRRTDPMGALKGGETYQVVFSGGKFTVSGYHEQTGKRETFAFGGANPDDALISLWGRVFSFDGLGRVWDPDYGLVGRLTIDAITGREIGPAACDMSGEWEIVYGERKPSLIVLKQEGDKITGIRRYEEGALPVRGVIRGGDVTLVQIFNNVKVLKKWYPDKVAAKLLGLKGHYTITMTPDCANLPGRYQGFYVEWDKADPRLRITERYLAGTPGASKKNPPREFVLRKK